MDSDGSLKWFAKRIEKWRHPDFQDEALARLIRTRGDALRVFKAICGLLDAGKHRDRLEEREAIYLLFKAGETPDDFSLLAKGIEYLVDDIYALTSKMDWEAKHLAAAETLCEALEVSLGRLRPSFTPTTTTDGEWGASIGLPKPLEAL